MLQPFFEWMQALPLSGAIQESWWMGAAVNILHLVSLVFFIGGLFIVDLRLLGVGMREQSTAQVYRDARPWMIAGLLMLVLSGIPQLTSLAVRNYYNGAFWNKMTILPIALLFTFTIRHRVAAAGERVAAPWPKIVGAVSILIWTAVIINGRLIGLT